MQNGWNLWQLLLRPLNIFGGKVWMIFWTQPFSLGQILYLFVLFRNKIFHSAQVSQFPRIEFKNYLFIFSDLCALKPDTIFYIMPPTVRNKPAWYSSAQSAITAAIKLKLQSRKLRVHFLPPFPADPTSLDPDGMHFSASAGVSYCMHVIDCAR